VATFPADSHPPIVYPAALTKDSVRADRAASLLGFLRSPAARPFFEGVILPALFRSASRRRPRRSPDARRTGAPRGCAGSRAKTRRAENVRAALLLVSRGEATLGIVYATDAASDPGVEVVATFPAVLARGHRLDIA
jgi:ABC-type molybdate transport system substrate-binding protein